MAFASTVQVRRQVSLELLGFWRNPDYAFFTFLLPLVLLGLLGAINRNDDVNGRTDLTAVTFLVPGIMAFAIAAASYSNLATRLAVLRVDGVLKRIRTTPLPPSAYLAGHLGSAVSVALLSSLSTVALGAVAFGVTPRSGGWPAIGLGVVLGVTCFAALGVAISSAIPHAEAAGPITNATYLPLAIISGVFDPTMSLPHWLETLVSLLPLEPLCATLTAGFDPRSSGVPGRDLLVLLVWCVGAVAAAVRTFSWNGSRR
jgi:ABC-2 type transport system permease protein